MTLFGCAWVHGNVELCWHRVEKGCTDGKQWTDRRGLVWARDDAFCAASVLAKDTEYRIYTAGWHGLTDDEAVELHKYLQSLGWVNNPDLGPNTLLFPEITTPGGV